MADPSTELQDAILARLLSDAAVAAIVEARIHDGRPADVAFPCITFGPADWQPDDYDCIIGRVETVQIDCWSRDNGRLWPVRKLADAVTAALHLAPLDLATHALALLRVISTRSMVDRDGLTGHAVITIEAQVELRE